MGNYSSDDLASLPATSADLTHVYDATDRTNVGTDDTNYVNQTGSAGYELHQYKDSITAANANVTWKGKSSLAPSSSKVQLQVYNVTGTAWEDVSGAGASNNVAAADTDFTLSGTIATADYLDTGVTTFRIYQAASPTTIVNIGANTGNTGDIQDNKFESLESIENCGGSTAYYIGSTDGSRESKLIYRPMLSSIPSGATIVSASLFLYVTADNGANNTINLYKIADANADWVEGNGNGGAVEGASCWNFKAYGSGGSTNWAGSAGLSTATTDYETTSLGSATHTTGATGYVQIDFNASGLAVLQSWFGDASNNGLLLRGSLVANSWSTVVSSEGTDNQRPYLAITYTV